MHERVQVHLIWMSAASAIRSSDAMQAHPFAIFVGHLKVLEMAKWL